MLAYAGKLILGISEFLASGLKPPFQLRDLSISSGQVVRHPGKLGLKIISLLGCLALDLSQLLCQALLLGPKVGKVPLSGSGRLTHLLEALLGFGKLCCSGRQLLGDSAHRLPSFCLLTSSLLKLTAHISQFLRACLIALLTSCNLFLHCCQTLLRLRQLGLEL